MHERRLVSPRTAGTQPAQSLPGRRRLEVYHNLAILLKRKFFWSHKERAKSKWRTDRTGNASPWMRDTDSQEKERRMYDWRLDASCSYTHTVTCSTHSQPASTHPDADLHQQHDFHVNSMLTDTRLQWERDNCRTSSHFLRRLKHRYRIKVAHTFKSTHSHHKPNSATSIFATHLLLWHYKHSFIPFTQKRCSLPGHDEYFIYSWIRDGR